MSGKIKLKPEVYESKFWQNVRRTAEQLEANRPKPDYPNLDKCEELMHLAVKKYGTPRSVDYFPGDYQWGPSWRVWWTNFHTHSNDGFPKASSGDLACYAPTLAEALQKALNADQELLIFEGRCAKGCVGYSDDSY